MTKGQLGKKTSLSQGVLMNNPNNMSSVQQQDKMLHVDDKENIPRKVTPTKIQHVNLPKSVSELSLSEKDLRPLGCDDNVFVTEASCEGDVSCVDQSTGSFNDGSSYVNVVHASPPSTDEKSDCAPKTSMLVTKPQHVETKSVDKKCAVVNKATPTTSNGVSPSATKPRGGGSTKKKRYIVVPSRYKSYNTSNNNASGNNSTLELSAIPCASGSDEKNKKRVLKKSSGISHSTPYLQPDHQPVMGTSLNDGSFMTSAMTTVQKKNNQSGTKQPQQQQLKKCLSVGEMRKPKDKVSQNAGQLSELDVEIAHCRYLQMVFFAHSGSKQVRSRRT